MQSSYIKSCTNHTSYAMLNFRAICPAVRRPFQKNKFIVSCITLPTEEGQEIDNIPFSLSGRRLRFREALAELKAKRRQPLVFFCPLPSLHAGNSHQMVIGCTTRGDAGDVSPPILKEGGIIPSNILRFLKFFISTFFEEKRS